MALVFGGAMGWFALSLFRAPQIRVTVPGTHEILLNDTGKYTIFWEYRSSVNGKQYSIADLPRGSVSIVQKDTQQSVPVSSPPSSKTTYSIGSRAGMSIAEFSISRSGVYVITAAYDSGQTQPETVFAIGRFDAFLVIVRTLVISFAGLVAGALVILRTFAKRRKFRELKDVVPVDRIWC